MSIAILCPTRGRPEQFRRMADSARLTANSYAIYSYQSLDDVNYTDTITFNYRYLDYPTSHKWNWLAKRALEAQSDQAKGGDAKLFMLGSDDTIFSTPGWDKALLDHYNNLEDKIHVYALKDSRDPEGTPHPIVTREYIDAMGYFVPPIFMHWFIDTWTVFIAKANNCFTHFHDYELIHDKPSDKGKADETHNRIRRMGWHERDKYVNDTCQHFLKSETKRLSDIIRNRHHQKFLQTLPEEFV